MVKGIAVGDFRKRNHEELLGELKRLRVLYNLILGRITTNQIY
jgi:hypothetical protein